MKPSGIGGMAVMEGVMMKNKEEYAVAVRKPNNEIAVEKSIHKDFSNKVKLFKLPIFRGMLAFIDSMVVGVKVLNYSASFFEEEEEQSKNKKDKSAKKAKNIDDDFEIEDVTAEHSEESVVSTPVDETSKKSGNDSTTLMMVFAVLLSIALSVALFMVLPVLLTQLISKVVDNNMIMNLIEGIVRLVIFIGYVMLASLMPEIKRTFMYHGAEHKTINCLENGCELTVENVKRHSKQHKRCGTSFMLLVVLISLVFFMVIPTGNLIWRLLSRVLLVPFIAGVSYEFIRLAGKSENKVVEALSKPGLWMQGLTTKEPDDTMIEVAIKSVDAVYDWRTFLAENFETKKSSTKKKSGTKQSGTSKSNVKTSDVDEIESKTEKVSSIKKDNVSKKDSTSKKQSTIMKENTIVNDNDGDLPVSEKQEKTSKTNKAKQADTLKKNDLKQESQSKGITSDRSSITPIKSKPSRDEEEEEDDEILKALDKYFDERNETKKAAEAK